MANAAILGTALNAFTIRQYGIYVGGLDVRAYTPIETISITENGPGDVSEATFTIEDTTGVVPLPASGSEIVIRDLILDYPIFAGYLNDYSATVIGLGRNITIHAFGLEALLDWYKAPTTLAYVTPSGLGAWVPEQIVAANAQAFPVAGLYAPEVDVFNGALRDGSAAWPVGSLNVGGFSIQVLIPSAAYDAGSFRAWISELSKYNARNGFVIPLAATVDFYRRLRVFELGRQPADYTNLVVNDAAGSPLVAANLKYDVHPGDIVRTVYVVGGNAAGSGYVSDGTGIVGRQEIITDANSTTTTTLAAAAAAYFATQNILVRGSFDLEDYVPAAGTVHPGSTVTLTDAQVSLAGQVYTIASIAKTFAGPAQTWTVHFGGRAPSVVETLRREYVATTAWSTTPA